MFSGIVEAKGKISLIKEFDDYLSIEISAPNGFNKNLKKALLVLNSCFINKNLLNVHAKAYFRPRHQMQIYE